MSVYYIHAPEIDLMKIGYAANPASRLVKMRVDSPTRLVLLAFEEGGKEAEAARHQQFAPLRRHGEWFAFEGDLAEFVGALPPFVKITKDRTGGATDIAKRAGISKAYASLILTGQRASIEVLLHVFTTTGWKHPRFAECDEATLKLLAERFPYVKFQAA